MKTLSRQEIYNGKIIKVYKDEVALEDGQRTTREVVAHREASAVVAITENRELLMVTQHRYPIHQDLLELPAGLIDEGETPLEAAKRELKEETGHEATDWHLLTSAFSSPGCHDEVIHIFAATGLTHVSDQSLDDDEVLTFAAIPINEIVQRIKSGSLKDSKTIIGVLLYESTQRG